MALALVLALPIGAALVTLGAGGSIVTVPVLIYAAGLDAHRAAGTSLVVVGLVALAGAIAQRRAIAPRIGLLFGAAGMAGTWPGVWLNHRLPSVWVEASFAATLLAVAALMQSPSRAEAGSRRAPLPALAAGLAVGVATGFFGVGGGFLIVPALSLLLGLGIAEAVATSLLVIALNSSAGLIGHVRYGAVDWRLGLALAGAALVGGALTLPIAARLDADRLRRLFASALVAIGLAMGAQSALALLA